MPSIFPSCFLPCDCEAYARYCCPDSVCPSVQMSNACIVTKRKHLAKKVQLFKSPTSFSMSLRWTSYVSPNPQRGPQKWINNWAFLKESLLQSFFVWKLSAAKLSGIHWPIYRCTNAWWGRPLRPQILGQSDPSPSKTATSNWYSPVLWQNEMIVCKCVNTIR